jgi:hypothetical protein
MAIKDWPGGVVTDIPVEPSGNFEDSAASGVWTLDQVADYVKQDLWPTPGNVDPSKYVEGVFSTYLYDGNSSNRDIVNNIDLAENGGLVWIKARSNAIQNELFDTERGIDRSLVTNSNAAEYYELNSFSGFNANGFSLSTAGNTNGSAVTYASWTFRKKAKFFDIVSGLTSDGSGNLPEFNHSLGSTPGCVIMKATDSGSNWVVYHNGLSGGGANQYIQLNQTNAATNATGFGIATDTTFEVGAGSALVPDVTYVAYLFASDAGGFGDDGSESIIKCGSLNNSTPAVLGWEPSFIITKRIDVAADWYILDAMRGLTVEDAGIQYLEANTANAEAASGGSVGMLINSQGFSTGNNGTYIYIAIRRPMKTPESGTEVFAPVNRTATAPTYYTGFVTDMQIMTLRNGFQNQLTDRLRGQKKLLTNATDAESAIGTEATYDWMTGVGNQDSASSNNIAWNFKRATGFFDVVAYTGTGVAKTEAHNLGVVPEFFIVKRRDTTGSWYCYTQEYGATQNVRLNADSEASPSSSIFNDTNPTSSVFTVGANQNTNGSGNTFISYLFATLAGVSKVGSYTGTGSNVNVDCGFSAGARFILIKRTDSTGDWYVYDSARGIVAGNDPYLLLNSTAAEVTSTDYIDPLSSGFTVTSSAPAALNASGGTYIFLAIA